jgi:hypothetical protein
MDSVTDKMKRVRNYCFVNCGWSILRGSRLASEKVSSNRQDMLFNSADPITCRQSAITLCIAAAVGTAWLLPGLPMNGQPEYLSKYLLRSAYINTVFIGSLNL